jgi:hypothetical protein
MLLLLSCYVVADANLLGLSCAALRYHVNFNRFHSDGVLVLSTDRAIVSLDPTSQQRRGSPTCSLYVLYAHHTTVTVSPVHIA